MKKIFLTVILLISLSITGCTVNEANKQNSVSDIAQIEEALNLKNNSETEWSYEQNTNSWTLSPVATVINPEIVNEQSVSVNIPGSYVLGIDTNNDGKADVTSSNVADSVNGSLVINKEVSVTSPNGQVYTAENAPVIINTGAQGYSAQETRNASGQYALDGYINVEIGNRGKQDTLTEYGQTVYTGDAPSCLVDQKNAVRFIRYNILLGNLPGSVDYFVSTGGSGGGAHAVMLAITSNHPDYYPYEAEAGAVGCYRLKDGDYSTKVQIGDKEVEISDGIWGCVAYSPITSLKEADMAQAFEYNLNSNYEYNTEFQKKLAGYLSEDYMEYINSLKLTANEADVNIDLDGNGNIGDTVNLSIEYDPNKYAQTNGYGGTYIDLYLKLFEQNLNDYLNGLDYAENWTWFDSNGNKLSDEQVSNMTLEEKKLAFLEGRYSEGNSNNKEPGNGPPDGNMMDLGNLPDLNGEPPSDMESNNTPPDLNGRPSGAPDKNTTQSTGTKADSSNYSTYSEMLSEYESDIKEIESEDSYGNNIVGLYNPMDYTTTKADQTEHPVWLKMIMGAQEGDISLFNSMNLALTLVSQGVNTDLEWQWNGGHVPKEIFGDSFSLTVDTMYGEYVNGAKKIENTKTKVTSNGDATEANGENISEWVNLNNSVASAQTQELLNYRTENAMKAVPGFDVIDYGQEDYVFGSSEKDARHWNSTLLDILKEHEDELSPLFNQNSND